MYLNDRIINQPLAPLASTLNGNDINCFSGNDGSITSLISGGTQPYTFKWSNSASTKDLSNLVAGKYVLEIIDDNLCVHQDSITLIQPNAALTAVLTVDDVDCYGDNSGGISLTPSGGTPTYSFDWNNGQSTQQNLTNISQGWYYVTVTDINLCTYSDSAFVPEPTELTITVGANSATAAANNGSTWVMINGGTPPYSSEWNDNNSQTTDTAINLGVGNYTLTVTDSKGCIKTASIDVLDAPDPSTISLFPNPSNGSVNVINLSSLGLDEEILIEVFDMSGKKSMEFNVIGKDTHTFEVYPSLSNGTYMVRIQNSRGIETRRLVVIQ
ncbi:MAG: T9SS type A sorting domain-containing protein [Bacteroidia bacterium]